MARGGGRALPEGFTFLPSWTQFLLSKLNLTKIIDTYGVYGGRGQGGGGGGFYHGPSVTGPSCAQFLLLKPLPDEIIDVYGA